MARMTLMVEDGDDAQPVELTPVRAVRPQGRAVQVVRHAGIFGYRLGPHGPIVNDLPAPHTMPGQTADPGCVLQLDRALVQMRLKTMMEGVETPAPTQ